MSTCSNGQTLALNLVMEYIIQTFNYACSSARTPIVTLQSSASAPYNSASQDIQFEQTVASITDPPA